MWIIYLLILVIWITTTAPASQDTGVQTAIPEAPTAITTPLPVEIKPAEIPQPIANVPQATKPPVTAPISQPSTTPKPATPAPATPIPQTPKPKEIIPAPTKVVELPAQKSPEIKPTPTTTLNKDQKRRAEQLTSIFENGTTEFNYRAIENLGDGRGYTAGKAGFTTATGDAFLVIKRYSEQVPNNALAPFLEQLEVLADEENDDTSDLEGYVSAWRTAAQDQRFQAAQDAIIDQLYYRPAMNVGDQIGLTTALGRAILYDTIIQHGGGNDPDSLSAIVQRTTQAAGGSPKNGIDEVSWLKQFLAKRKEDLLRPANRETQDVWAISISRVEVFEQILSEKNMDLHGPMRINTSDYQVTIY